MTIMHLYVVIFMYSYDFCMSFLFVLDVRFEPTNRMEILIHSISDVMAHYQWAWLHSVAM